MSFPLDRHAHRLTSHDLTKVFRGDTGTNSSNSPSDAPATKSRVSAKPLRVPFTIAIDTREQSYYTFESINADSNQSYRPLIIHSERATLAQGDYSLIDPDGSSHALAIAIERKSKQDLYGTLSAGRERFERELERLSDQVIHPFVMIEAEWSEIIRQPPEFSGMHPKTVFRSIIAWKFRFPKIHWVTMPGRRMAELATFRLLERYWKEANKKVRSVKS